MTINFNTLEYLIVNLIVVLPTLLLAFSHPNNNLRFKFKSVIIALVISATIFLIWDIYATYYKHWEFNRQFLLGWDFLGLPFEEYLFFFTVPFSCLFVWNEVRSFNNWEEFLIRLKSR